MMDFHSILFKNVEGANEKEILVSEAPDFFTDLNLDQIIDAITTEKDEYNLKPFFYTRLDNVDAIIYRHEVMRDLENLTLRNDIKLFAINMDKMRKYLAQIDKLHYNYQKQRVFLDTIEIYCDVINSLIHQLSKLDLKSKGFLQFREYLACYKKSDTFTSLNEETKTLITSLSSVTYSIFIKNNSVTIGLDETDIDYTDEVEKTFEKFKQEVVEDYRIKFTSTFRMDHVEANILDRVAKLYPEIFERLDSYSKKHVNFLDKTIAVFDREIQFYIAYLDYIEQFKQSGLNFCYPKISDKEKEIYDYEGFDLALANKLINEQSSIVCNDFYLKGNERIIVITGPNQGGKTTFARAFGQLHYLASLGCLVPGKEAKLLLYDNLFTLFEKEENIITLHGKLEDDLVRIHHVLDQSTANSIIIMNEVFTSTTLQDALFLSKVIMEKIIELDSISLWVTFIDELSSLSDKNVSMVSTVDPKNVALRTFKIVRKPADGFAYAISIARKYQLTYDCLMERIK